MSISACPQHDVKRKQQTASSLATQQKLREVVWRRRADDGSELTFDPTTITRDEAGAFVPMRRVAQSTSSRNITVNVWSQLDTCVHELESGLEHDLHRRLDRPGTSQHVVPQPLRVVLPRSGTHTPDFLQVTDEGVRVWDCKPKSHVDDSVEKLAAEMGEATAAVGWSYALFTGMTIEERINLMWLNGYRVHITIRGFSIRPWVATHRHAVLEAAAQPTTLGALFDLDDGSGEIISTIWHLVAAAELMVDLTVRLTPESTVRVA